MNTTPMRRLPALLVQLFIATFFLGCSGGDGSGGGGNPPPASPPPPPPPAALSAVFSDIQDNVFTPNCATAGCHAGASAPQGLQLDAQNSFALLVGVASSEVPTILRVAPGDPNNSYLIQKLEGTAAAGGQMPLGRPPLPQSTIDVVRQWIIDGATDDRAPASSPVRVSSLSIVPDSVLAASPAQIVAGFDRELDASTVNVNTFLLIASGGDDTFGDGNETSVAAASISVPLTNPQSAIFDLGTTVLAADRYQIRLLGSGASTILDLDANVLDGEPGGALPSGDGTAGGDFVAEFTIAAAAPSGATLDDIQATVFGPTCSGCHSGPTGNSLPSGMDLSSADASFASLVGIASLQQAAILRVAANDPDGSYLVQKLEGTAASGSRMPLGGAPLDAALIADIRTWISNGAQR